MSVMPSSNYDDSVYLRDTNSKPEKKAEPQSSQKTAKPDDVQENVEENNPQGGLDHSDPIESPDQGNQSGEEDGEELFHLMGIHEQQVSESNDGRSGAEGNDYGENQLDDAVSPDDPQNPDDPVSPDDPDEPQNPDDLENLDPDEFGRGEVENDEEKTEKQNQPEEEHQGIESVLDTLWKEQKNDTSTNHTTPIAVLEENSTNITSPNATSADAIISNNNSTKPLNQSDALDGGETVVESSEGEQNNQPSSNVSTPVVPLTDGVTTNNSTNITSANNTSDTITNNETLTKSLNTSDTADDSNGEIAEGSNAEPLSSIDAQSNNTNATAESLTSSTPDKNQTSSSGNSDLVAITNNNTSVEKSTEKNATVQDIETPKDSSSALNVSGVDSDADGSVSVNGTSKESLPTNTTKTNETKAETTATEDTPSEKTKSVELVDEIPALVVNSTEKTPDATKQLNSTTNLLDVPVIVIPDNKSLSNTTGNSTEPESLNNSTKTSTSAKLGDTTTNTTGTVNATEPDGDGNLRGSIK